MLDITLILLWLCMVVLIYGGLIHGALPLAIACGVIMVALVSSLPTLSGLDEERKTHYKEDKGGKDL